MVEKKREGLTVQHRIRNFAAVAALFATPAGTVASAPAPASTAAEEWVMTNTVSGQIKQRDASGILDYTCISLRSSKLRMSAIAQVTRHQNGGEANTHAVLDMRFKADAKTRYAGKILRFTPIPHSTDNDPNDGINTYPVENIRGQIRIEETNQYINGNRLKLVPFGPWPETFGPYVPATQFKFSGILSASTGKKSLLYTQLQPIALLAPKIYVKYDGHRILDAKLLTVGSGGIIPKGATPPSLAQPNWNITGAGVEIKPGSFQCI